MSKASARNILAQIESLLEEVSQDDPKGTINLLVDFLVEDDVWLHDNISNNTKVVLINAVNELKEE